MDFCKQYNAATQDKAGTIIPVEITVYEDRSFTFILKTPPASVLLQKAAGVEKGSGNPKTEKVGSVTRAQLREIAEIKLPDLNATGVEPAMRIIEGTAKNMGLTVVDCGCFWTFPPRSCSLFGVRSVSTSLSGVLVNWGGGGIASS